MILRPYSFNGTSILTGTSTDYKAQIPRSSAALQMQTSATYVRRAGAVPVYSGKEFEPYSIVLEVEAIHDFMTVFESLNTLFDTKDETPRQLIVQDIEDTGAEDPKQYYVYATPVQVQGGHDGPMATVTLAVDDPIWQSVTQNSLTFSTTASTGSTDVTNNGNDDAYPIFEITPSTQASTDYLYNSYIQVLPQSANWWTNRFLDLCGSTDVTFDTAALIAAGSMQSAGEDLRVFQGGNEVDRWLSGINTTDTHVYIRTSLPPAQTFALKTAIASTDTVTEIEIINTSAARAIMGGLSFAGRLIVDTTIGSTDTEEFTYTNKTMTDTKLAFTINARAARSTLAVAHAANDPVRFLPADFNLVYGNATVAAPTVDSTREPMPSATSRNSSFVYSKFSDLAGLRPNSWRQIAKVVSSPTLSRSGYYTSTNDAGDTDPASAMGVKALTFESGGVWRSDTVGLGWINYFPDGVASVSVTGEQYQNSASWPTLTLRAAGITQTGWVDLWAVAAQATTDYSTWTAFTKATTDATIPANTTYLQLYQNGTILGTTDYAAKGGISAITVGLTNYPHVMIRPGTNASKVDVTITNDTTGESMRIVYPMLVSDTIIIDGDPDFPTAKHQGIIVNGAVQLSSIRSAWLKLRPGSNTLSFQNNLSVATDMSIVVKHRDRANFM